MSDLIERQAAIDALRYAQHRFTVADEAGGMGTVKWSENVIYSAAAERVLTELPSAQPEQLWIPCSERMPENEATVLVTVAPPGIEPKVLEMSYSNGHWYRNDMLISPWWVVVAWRPMPKPYFKGVLCGEAFEEENESRIP